MTRIVGRQERKNQQKERIYTNGLLNRSPAHPSIMCKCTPRRETTRRRTTISHFKSELQVGTGGTREEWEEVLQ